MDHIYIVTIREYDSDRRDIDPKHVDSSIKYFKTDKSAQNYLCEQIYFHITTRLGDQVIVYVTDFPKDLLEYVETSDHEDIELRYVTTIKEEFKYNLSTLMLLYQELTKEEDESYLFDYSFDTQTIED